MAGTGSRTLKLSILGDIDSLKKSLDQGTVEVSTFGDKVTKFGKVAGAAFAAAGVAAAAYAGKLLVDGVKSAIEDEQAQAKLATTLQNVTGATNDQIAAVEKQIQKNQFLYGLSDEQLRPSYERLVRATKDLQTAQEAQSLAIDIAAGSGKSLEAVSNALGKAYEGNYTALGKLGVGLSSTQLKSMDLDSITKVLSQTFGGQAAEQADTYAGKMAILSQVVNEGKETVGSYVLDALTPMVTLLVDDAIPKILEFAESMGKKLQPVVEEVIFIFKEYLIPYFTAWWSFISDVLIPGIVNTLSPILAGLFKAFRSIGDAVKNNSENLEPFFNLLQDIAGFIVKYLAPALGTILGGALQVVGSIIGGLINGFGKLAGFIGDVVDNIRELIALVKSNPIIKGLGNVIDSVFGGGRAAGGTVMPGTSYLVGEKGPEIFTPSNTGFITPNNQMGGNTVINLNVSGAIDPEGTARTIINVLNNSYYRGTGGAGALVT